MFFFSRALSLASRLPLPLMPSLFDAEVGWNFQRPALAILLSSLARFFVVCSLLFLRRQPSNSAVFFHFPPLSSVPIDRFHLIALLLLLLLLPPPPAAASLCSSSPDSSCISPSRDPPLHRRELIPTASSNLPFPFSASSGSVLSPLSVLA
jgi:hypothetical protein